MSLTGALCPGGINLLNLFTAPRVACSHPDASQLPAPDFEHTSRCVATMHLMYFFGDDGKRVYTLKVRAVRCMPRQAAPLCNVCDAPSHARVRKRRVHICRRWTRLASPRYLHTPVRLHLHRWRRTTMRGTLTSPAFATLSCSPLLAGRQVLSPPSHRQEALRPLPAHAPGEAVVNCLSECSPPALSSSVPPSLSRGGGGSLEWRAAGRKRAADPRPTVQRGSALSYAHVLVLVWQALCLAVPGHP